MPLFKFDKIILHPKDIYQCFLVSEANDRINVSLMMKIVLKLFEKF